MELDSKPLEIPINAIRALRDLRDSVHPRKLWIDAVCINQEDKAERASQILLMSDIYSFAHLTYVWLGNEDPVIQVAVYILMLLKSLSPSFNDVEEADTPDPDLTLLKGIVGGDMVDNLSPKDGPLFVPPDHESLSDVSSDFPSHSADHYRWLDSASSTRSVDEILRRIPQGYRITRAHWQSILAPRCCRLTWPLFELPWFSRLWVFQEAALSRFCTFVFGSCRTIPWNDLARGVCLMRIFAIRDIPDPRGVDLIIGAVLQANCSRDGSPLLALVSQNVNQECTDPRDHIFGLLGLTVWAKQRLRWPPLIQPSYVKSVSDCMRDATRVMIEQEGNLSPLLHWYEVEQSPTWAVHWHRHKHISLSPIWSHATKASVLCSPNLRSLDLNLMQESPDLNMLLLRGHSIDFVHSTTALFTVEEVKVAKTGLATLEMTLRRIMDLSTRAGFDFPPRTITLTLLACGLPYQPCTSVTDELHSLECVVSDLWDELHDPKSERCSDPPISDTYILARFCGVYRNCKLFTTQAGQLCVGPGGLQDGDKVVRLFGLDLAALLRPEQSWFTFAGVAYIDREFPGVQDTSALPPEIFEIR
jgi:hypothetical protein